jgi:hypothetical protein
VVGVISAPNNIRSVYENTMRVSENPFAPRGYKFSFLVKNYHGMFAAIEDVDSVTAVNRHAGNLYKGPILR